MVLTFNSNETVLDGPCYVVTDHAVGNERQVVDTMTFEEALDVLAGTEPPIRVISPR